VKTQPHEGNKVLMEMHEMLDTINVIPTPGDPDHHFAMMMILHHEGAINMANVVLKEGCDAIIRKMANLIVQKQTMEIAELRAFLTGHLAGAVNLEFNMKMEMTMDVMDQDTSQQPVIGNIDHDFATLMISHHQSAMQMADLIIQYGHDPYMMNLAQEIRDDMEIEIAKFQVWLAQHKYRED
jgi:uncharacterized protein (DUF305 family)